MWLKLKRHLNREILQSPDDDSQLSLSKETSSGWWTAVYEVWNRLTKPFICCWTTFSFDYGRLSPWSFWQTSAKSHFFLPEFHQATGRLLKHIPRILHSLDLVELNSWVERIWWILALSSLEALSSQPHLLMMLNLNLNNCSASSVPMEQVLLDPSDSITSFLFPWR